MFRHLFRHWSRGNRATARDGLFWSLVLCQVYGCVAAATPALKQAPPPNAVIPPQQCPGSLNELVDRMLPDLPSYINRVRTRAGITKSYIVLAARPEFEPLPLSPSADLPPQTQSSEVKQVFFTTLMRRYEGRRIANLQEYHWVFFAGRPQDWQFAMMYSTIGVYPAATSQPPLPPRSSSDGSVAVAIKAWLADCRTGNLLPASRSKSIPPKRFPIRR